MEQTAINYHRLSLLIIQCTILYPLSLIIVLVLNALKMNARVRAIYFWLSGSEWQ